MLVLIFYSLISARLSPPSRSNTVSRSPSDDGLCNENFSYVRSVNRSKNIVLCYDLMPADRVMNSCGLYRTLKALARPI